MTRKRGIPRAATAIHVSGCSLRSCVRYSALLVDLTTDQVPKVGIRAVRGGKKRWCRLRINCTCAPAYLLHSRFFQQHMFCQMCMHLKQLGYETWVFCSRKVLYCRIRHCHQQQITPWFDKR